MLGHAFDGNNDEGWMNLTSACDMELKRLKSTSFIDTNTLSRLGFKKDITMWTYVGRSHGRPKFTSESYSPAREGGEEEEERGRGEDARATAVDSSMPQQPFLPRPSTRTKGRAPSTSAQISTPQISSQLTNLSSQIAHLSSHLTEKLDYFTATIISKLDSMDSKLDDLNLRVKNYEIHHSCFQPPPPQASPTSSPPHTPIHPTHTHPSPLASQPQPSPTFTLEGSLGSTPITKPIPPSPEP